MRDPYPLRVLPWALAAAASGVALWLALAPASRLEPAPGATRVADKQVPRVSAAREPEPVATPSARELASLRRCVERLRVVERALDRARAPRDPRELETAADELAEWLTRPAVKQVFQDRIDRALADERARARQRGVERREARRSAFDAWASEVLGLSGAERSQLDAYVCDLQALRERALADGTGEADGAEQDERSPAAVLERLHAERRELLGELEGALGERRYKQLRSIGGIGLLMAASECEP